MPPETIREFIDSRIEEGDFPSASWAVGGEQGIIAEGASGQAVKGADGIEAATGTIYDLASLTKPLVTGFLAARSIELGHFVVSDPVARFFDAFDTSEKQKITVADLLAHRSGFEAWRPLYLEVSALGRQERMEAVVRRIAKLPLEYPTGTRVIYSDLNFILLCALIENITGKTLAELFEEHLKGPLGLKDSCFVPRPDLFPRIAASEAGNDYERKMAREMGFDTGNQAWREGVIRGEVHDENCRFLGGVSGHAGLFSTARDTIILARQFLPETTTTLNPGSCRLFLQNLTPGLDQTRSASFQLAATETSSAHGVVPDSSIGHLGFTGTMLWIDPVNRRFYVLLTNRTHATQPPFADLSGARRGFLKLASALPGER